VRVAGRFKLDRLIGRGSFGEIFFAHDTITSKDVAVKFEQLRVKRPQVFEEAKFLRVF
jgi:serine/threonine protein kinase